MIEPAATRNMEDMRLLLTARLKGSAHVAPADLQLAVDLLQAKSEVRRRKRTRTCLVCDVTQPPRPDKDTCTHECTHGRAGTHMRTHVRTNTHPQGQLIYAKYALEFMAFKRGGAWSLRELGACLPHGLAGAHELSMRVLVSRLAAERPDLVSLLRDKVLPVLVAMREPLSTEQVAWACGAWPAAWPADHPDAAPASGSGAPKEANVSMLLDLLTNIFPHRPAHKASGRQALTTGPAQLVYPYHKSVLDWLEDARAGDYRVDVGAGHALLALRCVPYCHKALTADHHPWLRAPGADDGICAAAAYEEPNDYALRHFATHMAAAAAATAHLAAGVLTDYTLIEAVFRQGGGYAFVRDWGAHARHPAAAEEARDGHRWLKVQERLCVCC